MELRPGMYKTWASSLMRRMALVYKDEKKKSKPVPYRAQSLCLDQALRLCFREGSMADYVDSWPLSSLDRKKAVKLKTCNGLTSAPGVFLSTLH